MARRKNRFHCTKKVHFRGTNHSNTILTNISTCACSDHGRGFELDKNRQRSITFQGDIGYGVR